MSKTVVATGVFLLSVLFPLRTTAASLFSGLYTFGDSLSDSGNVSDFTGGIIPPSPPYFQGRFSNGLNWVDYLAQDLELNPVTLTDVVLEGATPSDGINFAFGGATTGTENTVSLTFPLIPDLPALQQEIGLFTNLVPTADPNALYIVWAGANDYLPTQGTFVPFTEPNEPLENLSNAVTALAGVGAKNILVANLPPLGTVPVARSVDAQIPGTAARLNALTEAHNSGLSAILNNLEQSLASDVNLISLDVNSLFNQALNNPSEFGFTNVTDACLVSLDPLIVCDNPDEFLFWDTQHPTTLAHQQIAQLALNTLNQEDSESVPEPNSASMILALGAWGGGLTFLKRKRAKAKV